MDAPAPCRTLYVRNLPDKLKKHRLRRLLHAACSPYGRVVHIVAEKSIPLRGQAFITFHTQASATAALRKLHASEFMGNHISVSYARALSDKAASEKLGGDSTLSRNKRAAKRRADALAVKRDHIAAAEQQQQQHALASTAVPSSTAMPNAPPIVAAIVPHPIAAPAVPNRILFVQNIPTALDKHAKKELVSDVLSDLFARFAGFVEVRSVPGKHTIAFVEFSSEQEAAVALSGLNAHPLGDPPQPIHVSFANK
ncbi:U2 small nuclear ribonucleoprotein B'' [Gracilariopsis chorda]|uniref:U2 small nuclear ribonucleoprotein B n=1 Tax=Gracilariopsis chorda TaxID=448386 RepID=A0A2V3J0Q8_9FLOR|nr:U2 small nuclear ribonucleoprotein B'' [Gracilariopsis chorda]|eukprot:PXF47964.1 U2 small nuclear ribonucleoprotein B'' [Gracilariopsis chorda]